MDKSENKRRTVTGGVAIPLYRPPLKLLLWLYSYNAIDT